MEYIYCTDEVRDGLIANLEYLVNPDSHPESKHPDFPGTFCTQNPQSLLTLDSLYSRALVVEAYAQGDYESWKQLCVDGCTISKRGKPPILVPKSPEISYFPSFEVANSPRISMKKWETRERKLLVRDAVMHGYAHVINQINDEIIKLFHFSSRHNKMIEWQDPFYGFLCAFNNLPEGHRLVINPNLLEDWAYDPELQDAYRPIGTNLDKVITSYGMPSQLCYQIGPKEDLGLIWFYQDMTILPYREKNDGDLAIVAYCNPGMGLWDKSLVKGYYWNQSPIWDCGDLGNDASLAVALDVNRLKMILDAQEKGVVSFWTLALACEKLAAAANILKNRSIEKNDENPG